MGAGWEPGTATGVGSMPGPDALEACRLIFGELTLPHLPELPGRGPGADIIGRGALFLTDLHVDLQPAGWRLVTRAGRDEQRARSLLADDLDALEEAAADYRGRLKLQAAGPWTLAAGLELPRGNRALSDPGAVVDLSESLADGLAAHVHAVRRRVPGVSEIYVQLDEPSLPAVLSGGVPTASGFGALAAVEEEAARGGLARVQAAVAGAGAVPGVHCCAADPPVSLMTGAGAGFVSVDAGLHRRESDDAIGAAVEAGVLLALGLVKATAVDLAELSSVAHTVEPAMALWRRLGFDPQRLAEVVAVTPTCGLAGADQSYARLALRRCREAARALAEGPA
jgi:methionine synthase II (cobalamin-independent)